MQSGPCSTWLCMGTVCMDSNSMSSSAYYSKMAMRQSCKLYRNTTTVACNTLLPFEQRQPRCIAGLSPHGAAEREARKSDAGNAACL